LVAQLTILDRERIDRRHHYPLRRLHFLSELLAAKNDYIVTIDPTPQVFPSFRFRPGKIEVTTPDPRTFLLVMLDQRKRLRVMHDDEVVIEKVADAVLVKHLFKNFFFDF